MKPMANSKFTVDTSTAETARAATVAAQRASIAAGQTAAEVRALAPVAFTGNYADMVGTPPQYEGFPIGAIYISVTPTNPGTTLGYGTWTAFGTGRVLVGVDVGDTDFDTVEETGGSKTATYSPDYVAP